MWAVVYGGCLIESSEKIEKDREIFVKKLTIFEITNCTTNDALLNTAVLMDIFRL